MVIADWTFGQLMWSMVVFFAWIMWIWLLVVIFTDLFSRHDISGWSKTGWCLFVLLLPFVGVLFYIGFQGKEMAQRRAKDASDSQAQFDSYVRNVAASNGPTAEIASAKQLLDSGAINQSEFDAIKGKALAAA
jgi:hypothetical protein